MTRPPGSDATLTAKQGTAVPSNRHAPAFSQLTLGIGSPRDEKPSERQPAPNPPAGNRATVRAAETERKHSDETGRPDNAVKPRKPRGAAKGSGGKRRAASTAESTRYELRHYVALHELVEPHDFDWYIGGGRRFFALDDGRGDGGGGRELSNLREIGEAIAADGAVESR